MKNMKSMKKPKAMRDRGSDAFAKIEAKGGTAMIGQMTGQMRPGMPHSSRERWENTSESHRRREEVLRHLDRLYALSRRGLWRLFLFLLISVAALCSRDSDLLSMVPENLRPIIGAPPPVGLIHLVLAISTVSALILLAGRTTGDARPGPGWLQFGLSSFFYPLYAGSNALNEAFPAIFAAGLIVLTLEHFTNWSHTCKLIREEKERLQALA